MYFKRGETAYSFGHKSCIASPVNHYGCSGVVNSFALNLVGKLFNNNNSGTTLLLHMYKDSFPYSLFSFNWSRPQVSSFFKFYSERKSLLDWPLSIFSTKPFPMCPFRILNFESILSIRLHLHQNC